MCIIGEIIVSCEHQEAKERWLSESRDKTVFLKQKARMVLIDSFSDKAR